MNYLAIQRVDNGWIVDGKENPDGPHFTIVGKMFVFNKIEDLTAQLPALLGVTKQLDCVELAREVPAGHMVSGTPYDNPI